MTGEEEALKMDKMKQHARELDTLCILPLVDKGIYDLAMEPELDTDFTEVNLAKMEAKQESMSSVDSHANSAGGSFCYHCFKSWTW